MTIEQLKYIVAIAKYGTLKDASEDLHVTLSALSQGLNRLEKELGLTLFTRNRTGSSITKEGKVIVNHAKKVLDALDDLTEVAQVMQNRLTGTLKVASIPGPFFKLFTIVQQMKSIYPEINIQIREQNSQTMLEELLSEKVDVALAVYNDEDIQKNPNLTFTKITSCNMLIVAHQDSPVIQHNQAVTAELKKQPVIIFDDKMVIATMNEIKYAFGRNDIVISVNNPHIVQQYVEENKAYTVGLDLTFTHSKSFMQNMNFAKIDFLTTIPVEHTFGIVTKANRHETQLMKEFAYELKKEFKDYVKEITPIER
ncbi:LysR family transcriptional regulator [Kurthia huakuii]|uniref:LysR family transcriptional regulator n=1 Tax=Kurthia huakuii TaxID=1421019 RepID=UPI0004962A7E|nr:LysR family transcriptional regulator [Kurthia huakuii]MBM7700387.1 DNA-binding transcriptional LysR family regulator [Kurthia huakuii]